MYNTAWDRNKLPKRPTMDALASAQLLAEHYGRRTKIIVLDEIGQMLNQTERLARVRDLARMAAHNARLYLDGLEN